MIMFVLVVEFLLALLVLALYGTLFLTLFSHAPYVPSRRRETERLIALANIKPDEQVIDLGSGDGKLVLAAARAGAYAVGVERQPFLTWISRLRAKRQGLSGRARFVIGNLFTHDLSGADVVLTYLLPETMQKLKQKFEQELKPGARVVSNAFSVSGWEPTVVDRDGKTPPIWIYQR